jgi:phage terminase large subunit
MLNYMQPDYTDIFIRRQQKLNALRSNPELLAAMKIHYKENPWDFIDDWGMTFDPRQIERGLLATVPFVMWPRQVDYIKWVVERWRAGEYGIVEKSRDCGVTWLSVALAVTLFLFVPGYSAGFGSAKEAKVDTKGDPDCIFEKIRFFLRHIPVEFMPAGFNERLHSGFMKLTNPENDASITGDAGDQIGRGGRKSMWLIDEAAFVEHQLLVDNAISQATTCHIDISTYNGNGNLFYRKSMRFDKTRRKFIFDWRDDPRKDDVWYKKQKEEKDTITIAQEIDRDPNASAEDVFIPSKWVKAAIDLHKLLGLQPSGIRVTAFDPADIGDAKAVVSRHGFVVTAADLMMEGDITQAIPWAYDEAFKHNSDALVYDADGMGAPTMKLTFDRYAAGRVPVIPYYGSGALRDKDGRYGDNPDHPDRDLKRNRDLFVNFRAQAATWLRDRFEAAYNVRQHIERGGVVMGIDVENLISIDSSCARQFELVAELSRPKRIYTNDGKIKVESKKEMKNRQIESPNLFDACKMAFSVKVPTREKKSNRIKTRTIRVRDKGLGL